MCTCEPRGACGMSSSRWPRTSFSRCSFASTSETDGDDQRLIDSSAELSAGGWLISAGIRGPENWAGSRWILQRRRACWLATICATARLAIDPSSSCLSSSGSCVLL